jgi:hypothetical protein
MTTVLPDWSPGLSFRESETCVMCGYEKLSLILCAPEEIYQSEKVYIVKTLQGIIQNDNWQRGFRDADIESKKHGYSKRIYLGTREDGRRKLALLVLD